MEEVKICMICKKNIGNRACARCGNIVCDMCYSAEKHSCVNCLIGKVVKKE